jgi:hypothetical protein
LFKINLESAVASLLEFLNLIAAVPATVVIVSIGNATFVTVVLTTSCPVNVPPVSGKYVPDKLGMSPAVSVSQSGAAPFVPSPVIRRNLRVVVVLGESVVRVSVADAYGSVNAATVLSPVPPRVIPNVPDVILLAARLGISLGTSKRKLGVMGTTTVIGCDPPKFNIYEGIA